jgi:hypothetical protein
MNIVLNLNQFNIEDLNIMEMKKNKLMNGIFTKITYNNPDIQLNGVYVKFNINNLALDKKEEHQSVFYRDHVQENKNTRYDVKFPVSDPINLYNINEIIRIETELLNKYKEHKKQYENTNIYIIPVHKKKIYSIKYNLLNGQYKMYSDKLLESLSHNDSQGSGIANHIVPTASGIANMSFIFKISGIWEDDLNIGITYKIIHCI